MSFECFKYSCRYKQYIRKEDIVELNRDYLLQEIGISTKIKYICITSLLHSLQMKKKSWKSLLRTVWYKHTFVRQRRNFENLILLNILPEFCNKITHKTNLSWCDIKLLCSESLRKYIGDVYSTQCRKSDGSLLKK